MAHWRWVLDRILAYNHGTRRIDKPWHVYWSILSTDGNTWLYRRVNKIEAHRVDPFHVFAWAPIMIIPFCMNYMESQQMSYNVPCNLQMSGLLVFSSLVINIVGSAYCPMCSWAYQTSCRGYLFLLWVPVGQICAMAILKSLTANVQVLYRFLDYFSKFDWDNYGISLNGPVAVSSFPEILGKQHPFEQLDDCLNN